ncbi:MAG: hypothetical protein HQK82_11185 [Desulfovibrionaceae bacterium]|nr:hypothetical protein [Desulfovibrionaceae bacterium]
MTPKDKHVAFRPHAEAFKNVVWEEPNRAKHEAKRPYPPFRIAKFLDWARIKKRKDIEHRDQPDRFQALVAWRISEPPPIFFVVYSKIDGNLNLISIRYANDQERETFYR